MLKRKIDSVLRDWKNDSHKKTALCLIGARQTGKTTAVRMFARQEYSCFLELNFLDNPQARAVFEPEDGVNRILQRISAISQTPLVPGKTLILLDEIQECPQARTAVKFLVEDGRFDYIETGSLLGVKVQDIKSYPVGFETLVNVYPLDFEEFLWAMNVQDSLLEYLAGCFQDRTPVDGFIHGQMLSLFRQYLVIGGMPEAVQVYRDTGNVREAVQIQQRILDLYRLDIAKYTAPRERIKVQDLFASIPSQLNEKSPRFYLTAINPNARLNRYESGLVWLIEAGTVLPCYAVSEPVIPLALQEKRSMFRLFLADTGLLCASLDQNIQARILSQDPSVNIGVLLENMFAQLFTAGGYQLHYFNSKKHGEVDFVLGSQDGVRLAEIKSGNDWKNHAALNNVLKTGWTFEQTTVFCQSPGEYTEQISYLPWYFILFERKPETPDLIIPPFNFESLDFPGQN